MNKIQLLKKTETSSGMQFSMQFNMFSMHKALVKPLAATNGEIWNISVVMYF